MKRLSGSGKRTMQQLSESLQHQLNMYALGASAAGVGILALAQPAHAKIVYTKAHTIISRGTVFPLDLNHDGIKDVILSNKSYNGTCTAGKKPCYILSRTLFAIPARPGNRVWGRTNYADHSASALSAGVRIGRKGQFLPSTGTMVRVIPSSSVCKGAWTDVSDRYLGIKFQVKGKSHYGWARLNVSCVDNVVTATLTGYAYETIANKSIVTGRTKGTENIGVEKPHAAVTKPTPESATLSALALGAPGLSIWRKE
jgi:hypothetical protein